MLPQVWRFCGADMSSVLARCTILILGQCIRGYIVACSLPGTLICILQIGPVCPRLPDRGQRGVGRREKGNVSTNEAKYAQTLSHLHDKSVRSFGPGQITRANNWHVASIKHPRPEKREFGVLITFKCVSACVSACVRARVACVYNYADMHYKPCMNAHIHHQYIHHVASGR